jgi:hypothetical protein
MAYEHARWPVLTNDERSRWPCIPRRHWRDIILELWGNDAIIREPQYLLLVTDASTLEIIMHLSDANTLGQVERMYLMRLRDEITAETNTSFLGKPHPQRIAIDTRLTYSPRSTRCSIQRRHQESTRTPP